ncbi:hypothetical protein [Nocardiopsis lucentensis]|uniref:hypothetical protein n=1 Tax=Nocardiopsis lucentensis TaxID=53441 RepID=UPI000347B461|nr:hypothetical protein [Nocardiopsis lucentensis]
MDPLSAVTGTLGLFALVTLLGWPQIRAFVASQQHRRAALEQKKRDALNPPAVCQCGHARAFHAPAEVGAGACAAEVEVEGAPPRDCRCQQYVGPEPLPEFNV